MIPIFHSTILWWLLKIILKKIQTLRWSLESPKSFQNPFKLIKMMWTLSWDNRYLLMTYPHKIMESKTKTNYSTIFSQNRNQTCQKFTNFSHPKAFQGSKAIKKGFDKATPYFIIEISIEFIYICKHHELQISITRSHLPHQCILTAKPIRWTRQCRHLRDRQHSTWKRQPILRKSKWSQWKWK